MRFRFIVALAALILSNSGFAMGARYWQNFTNNAGGWSALDATNYPWSVTGGYYQNDVATSGAATSITLYSSTGLWQDNFAYSFRIYSSWSGTGNQLGGIFGYTSPGNYYEVLTNIQGNVSVYHYINGDPTLVASGSVPGFAEDTFVSMQLSILSGRLSVRIADNPTAFTFPEPSTSVAISPLNNGRIGLVTRSDMGRFDDVDVVNLYWRTSFSGASLVPLASGDCSLNQCWQSITGTDTNFPDQQWPPVVWGSPPARDAKFQLLVSGVNLTPSTIDQYMHPEIQLVTGHGGVNTYALYQTIRQYGPGSTQMPYVIFPSTSKPQGPLYARMWVKLQDNLRDVQIDDWRIFFQFKTDQDFRMSVYVNTWNNDTAVPPVKDHRPHWKIETDSDGNPNPPKPTVVYTERWETETPVPLGQWFKFEVFWDRGAPGSSDGRAWVAVDGHMLFDYTSKLWGENNAMINRIMLPTLYHGKNQADPATNKFTEQWIDDIEIWDGFPPSASSEH